MSYKRTYADRREYLIKAVAKRRKAIKEKAIEYLGGHCYFLDIIEVIRLWIFIILMKVQKSLVYLKMD